MRILIIDSSYFVFYRYYALVNYFKLSGKRSDFTDVVDDVEFLNKYKEIFERTVFDLIKKHFGIKKKDFDKNIQDDVIILFAKDCYRGDIWRNEIHPEYKKNRDQQKHKIPFDGRIFQYVNQDVIPTLITRYKSNMNVIESCSAEADDIVAIICKSLYESIPYRNNVYVAENETNIAMVPTSTSTSMNKVVVITNDHDYLQLLDIVDSIYNLQGQDLSKKAQKGPSVKNMYKKVLLGDPSDNISGVLGKKEVVRILSEDDPLKIELLIKDVLKDTSSMEAYEKNKTLISFEYIPIYIKTDVENKLYEILKDFKINMEMKNQVEI